MFIKLNIGTKLKLILSYHRYWQENHSSIFTEQNMKIIISRIGFLMQQFMVIVGEMATTLERSLCNLAIILKNALCSKNKL